MEENIISEQEMEIVQEDLTENASGECEDEIVENSDGEASEERGQTNKDESVIDDNEINKSSQMELFAEVNSKLDHLTQLFTQKIQHTTHEERIVDQMHAELQKYKEDMYAQLVRPILLDIIEMRDSIIRISNAYVQKPEEEQRIPLKTFSDYSFDIQDILEKNNITIYVSEEGDTFNPVKQRALKKIKTPVEELHGRVAESLSSGYDYLGKTISAEKVAVYVYEKPAETKGVND